MCHHQLLKVLLFIAVLCWVKENEFRLINKIKLSSPQPFDIRLLKFLLGIIQFHMDLLDF